MSKTVASLAQLIQGTVVGDGSVPIRGITHIEAPKEGAITFVQDTRTLKRLEDSPIACLIVPPTIKESKKPLIQVPQPKLGWAKLLEVFYPVREPARTVSEKAFIAPGAKLGQDVTVEPFAVIEDGVEIGERSIIRSHAFISRNVKIGPDCRIEPSVTIYPDCRLGARVILHAGSVVGADGFGYVHTPDRQEKIPQVGNVVIEDDVEIGSCAAIDRATLGSTVIGKGCKIDNLVQIAHNVTLGAHTVISAQTGISGSSKVGSHVTMGGKVGLGDHVEIGDWTMVGAGAGLPSGKKVPPKQIIFGEPARPYQEARRQIAAQWRSAEMLDDIRKLKAKIAELEKLLQKQGVSETGASPSR